MKRFVSIAPRRIILLSFLFITSGVEASSSTSTTPWHSRSKRQRPLDLLVPLRGGGRGGGAFQQSNGRLIAKSQKPSTRLAAVDRSEEGGTTIPNEVMNLVKSILGAGVVGIPAGIAAFADNPTALVPATVLIMCIGTLAGYGFCLIGTVCSKTKAPSYREAWSRSVGHRTSWIPALAAMLVTCCTVLTCSIILADTLPSIIQALTGGGDGESFSLSRNTALLLNTILLTPLCLMRDLSRLSPFSCIGLAGTLYMAAAMCVRWLMKSYAPGTPLYESLPADIAPRFGKAGWKAAFSNSQIAILISMLSSAFMAHYNASKFFWELRDNTLPRFYTMAASSFVISSTFMAIIAAAGFATFGSNCQSMILLNYSPKDNLINFARFALFLSIFFSFPLCFVGAREQLLDLAGCHGNRRRELSSPLTMTILAIITSLAWNLRDIRVILALGGTLQRHCPK